MRWISAFLSGLIFGGGLGIAGMTQPAKVQAFLDLTGRWDPSLAFVMVGAIGVYAVALRLILRRKTPIFGERFDLPSLRAIDARLVGGAALFGVGWGMAGYCPGPAVVNLATGSQHALGFFAAMVVGMVIVNLFDRRSNEAMDPPLSIPAPQEAP